MSEKYSLKTTFFMNLIQKTVKTLKVDKNRSNVSEVNELKNRIFNHCFDYLLTNLNKILKFVNQSFLLGNPQNISIINTIIEQKVNKSLFFEIL